MNPNQHGEVFVTNDGAETDLDLGHYERFTEYLLLSMIILLLVVFIKVLLKMKEKVNTWEILFKLFHTLRMK